MSISVREFFVEVTYPSRLHGRTSHRSAHQKTRGSIPDPGSPDPPLYATLIVATLTKDNDQEDEEVAAEDEEDMGVIETYSNYKPSKLKVTLSYCPIILFLISGGITNTCLDLILGWPATSRPCC